MSATFYSLCASSQNLLGKPFPEYPQHTLFEWYSSPERHIDLLRFMARRASINLQLLNKMDFFRRTAESARLYGIDFFSVVTR